MIAYAQGLPVVHAPLYTLTQMMYSRPWGDETAEDPEHVERIAAADMQYPVLLDPKGQILDGYHRLHRALRERHKTVKTIRLLEMPPPDWVLPATCRP